MSQQQEGRDVGPEWGGQCLLILLLLQYFALEDSFPEDAVFRKAVGVRRVTFQILQLHDGMEPSPGAALRRN